VARLFISHSHDNNAAAIALCDWLSQEGYKDVFLDVDPNRGLVVGDRWQEALKAAADRCEAVLFLISPAWLSSKWCLAEFLLAKTLHKRIFGLLIEATPADRVPVEMAAEWQLCDLTAPEGVAATANAKSGGMAFREAGLELLRRGLVRAGLDPRSFPWPPPGDPHRAPYRGLRALEAEDAAVFFGRDAAIVRALDRIRGLAEGGVERLFVVLGASGSGKSSFLRAGLWPRLVRDDVTFLPVSIIRPETTVITGSAGLANALAQTFERLGKPRAAGRIKEALTGGTGSFALLLDELVTLAKDRSAKFSDMQTEPTVVLALDQAEELFNPDGAAEAATFIQLLGEALTPSRRVIMLATIRSDRYEMLQAEGRLADAKRELFDLPPILPSEFKSVIEGPANRVAETSGQLSVEPALTEQLIQDAKGADALPLLGFTLERLYADYGSEGRLRLADYNKLGGVQGSIEAVVANALTEPGRSPAIPFDKEAQLAALRAAFIPWLARIDPDTGVPMRRVARMDEIPDGSSAVVERLVSARLLIADRRAGVDVVEVAHESLLRQWPALAAWLEADIADLKVAEGVERTAGEWARNGRLEAWLDHRAERLIAAERLMARPDFRKRLGEIGASYLDACKAREDSERRAKEEALAHEQMRLAEVAAAQIRTARMQRMARWALAAIAVVVVCGLAAVALLYRQLGTQRVALEEGRANLYSELSTVERLHENWDSALRLSVHGARLALVQQGSATVIGRVELLAALSQAGWQLSIGGLDYWSANFSPDGTKIVAGAVDGSVRIWDVRSGKQLAIMRGHEASLRSAIFNADGSRILTASDDHTARLWDVATQKQIAVLRGHSDVVTNANFSPDGAKIVTSSFDKTIRIWDAATAEQIQVIRGHDDWVFSAAFSPDGSRIVSASQDKTVRIWDAASGAETATLRGHEGPVYYAGYKRDGSQISSASGDNTARIWDVSTGKELMVLRGHDDYLNSAVFSPDGSEILTASADKTARLWDTATGRQIAILRGHVNYLNRAAFSPDGSQIVTSSKDQTIRIWQTVSRKEVAVLADHDNYVNSAPFNSAGTQIVTASQDMTARIWDVATAKSIVVLRGHEAPVRSANFSPDGSRVVTGSQDKTARIWDAATGKELVVLRGHDNWVLATSFSPDGKRVATASWDRTLRIWDAATGQQLVVMQGHEKPVWAASFSPDGSRLVSASWDDTARIWDASTGKELVVLRGHDGYLNSAVFGRDGSQVLTASADETARLWDAASGKEIRAFRGNESTVYDAAFSPDGTRIVTGGADDTARIWETATGNEVAVLRGHDNWVLSAAFDSTGGKIVTASRDKTARIWNAGVPIESTKDLIAEACARRLGGLSILTRDEMRLAGYPDATPEIDVCAGIE
jgi:WD40 repeat protein